MHITIRQSTGLKCIMQISTTLQIGPLRLRGVNYADNELLHYTHYGILHLPHSLVYSGQVDPAAPVVGSAIQAPQL